jgi:hypothetical protein
MRKLSARVNVFQWLFYSLIGVTGAPQGKVGNDHVGFISGWWFATCFPYNYWE